MVLSASVAYLLKLVIPVYLLTAALFFSIEFSSTALIAFLVSYVLIFQISANMYHRYWGHRQFELNKTFEMATSFLGLFAMTGDPLSFARTHRWHHAHADTDEDLHSPIHGRVHSLIGWLFKGKSVRGVWIEDLLTADYSYLQTLSAHKIKMIWATLAVLALVSREALLGVLVTMCLSFLLEMTSNAFAHSPTEKRAVNFPALSWLALEPYHLDHHIDPRGIPKSDPGFHLIKFLTALNLVKYRSEA